MNDAGINVFVPYYPMLTTETLESYQLSTPEAEFVTEEPAEGIYYPATVNMRVDGERVAVEGFKVLPENWADSMYWSFDALSNLILYTEVEENKAAEALETLADKQAQINELFEELKGLIPSAEDPFELATAFSAQCAKEVHEMAVELTLGLNP